MTSNEAKKFIGHCVEFWQSCNANKVPCEISIGERYLRVICKPKNDFEDHFEYDLHDVLESLTKDLSGDIEYIIDEHFKIETV